MKSLLPLFFLISVFASPSLYAASTRYISDDLFTYLHSGPSNKFRIIGSVNAGDQVTFLSEDKKTGYSQIRDLKDRDGWIKSSFISTKEGLKARVPVLEQQLTETQTALAQAQTTSDQKNKALQDTLELRTTQLDELAEQNARLQEELTVLQAQSSKLQDKIDVEKNELLMRWFGYGGMVAGFGLLLGLILPLLIPKRRKRNNGWA